MAANTASKTPKTAYYTSTSELYHGLRWAYGIMVEEHTQRRLPSYRSVYMVLSLLVFDCNWNDGCVTKSHQAIREQTGGLDTQAVTHAVKWLRTQGWIEVVGEFAPGQRSRTYRITLPRPSLPRPPLKRRHPRPEQHKPSIVEQYGHIQ